MSFETPILFEMRDAVKALMVRIDQLNEENRKHQVLMIENQQIIAENMIHLHDRMKMMEKILFLETSDGR
jgi:hypothetical protein